MKITHHLLIHVPFISIILLFTSCSTGYQPRGISGGYTSEQVEDNSYMVTFKGNQHTSEEKVRSYLFYRCAELTLEADYQYFVVAADLSHWEETEIKPTLEQPSAQSATASGGVKNVVTPSFDVSTVSSQYVGEFLIHMYTVVPDEMKDSAIRASQVIHELKDEIN